VDNQMMSVLLQSVGESFQMMIFGTIFAYVLGLPMGILLVVTAKDGIRPNLVVYKVLDIVVNITRSVPFLILLVTIMPFTRMVVGTTIGTKATIVSLVVSAAPFVARLVESSIQEVDRGIIEAAQSMGAGTFQIIYKVMLPEARPSLIVNAAIAAATILGYSAMAGFVGGGGLGTVAINYGYQRGQTDIMIITVILLVVIVQVFQSIGMKLARVLDKRKE